MNSECANNMILEMHYSVDKHSIYQNLKFSDYTKQTEQTKFLILSEADTKHELSVLNMFQIPPFLLYT